MPSRIPGGFVVERRKAGTPRLGRRALSGLGAVLALLALVGVWMPTLPAGAQAICDPYSGCNTTTTSTAPRQAATLVLSTNVGRPGERIHVHACGFQPGAAVNVTFNGVVIGSATADANGCIDLDVTIPNVAPGQYQLCVVSAGVAPMCQTFTVLGESFRQGGALSFTGFHAAAAVALGLIAIVLGRLLVNRNRRRPRRA